MVNKVVGYIGCHTMAEVQTQKNGSSGKRGAAAREKVLVANRSQIYGNSLNSIE